MGRLRVAANASTVHLEQITLPVDHQQRVHGVEEMINTFSNSSFMLEIVWYRWSRVGR